jgi:hypothetical protein
MGVSSPAPDYFHHDDAVSKRNNIVPPCKHSGSDVCVNQGRYAENNFNHPTFMNILLLFMMQRDSGLTFPLFHLTGKKNNFFSFVVLRQI